jgi:hypothetical protein
MDFEKTYYEMSSDNTDRTIDFGAAQSVWGGTFCKGKKLEWPPEKTKEKPAKSSGTRRHLLSETEIFHDNAEEYKQLFASEYSIDLLPSDFFPKKKIAEFMPGLLPIFSDKLVGALKEIGADNFQLFPIGITDPETGKIAKNFKVVNVLAYYSKKELAKLNEPPLLMHLNEQGALNLLFAHEKVKDHLTKKGFKGIQFEAFAWRNL